MVETVLLPVAKWLLAAVTLLAKMLAGVGLSLALFASPAAIAVAIVGSKRWIAVLVMLVLAGFFAVGQYQAEHAPEAVHEHIGELRLYVALTFALFSAPGIVMAAGLARGWTYTRVVTVVSVLAFGLMTLGVILNWQDWNAQFDSFFETQRQAIKSQTDQRGQEYVDDALAAMAWLRDNKQAFNFSITFLIGLVLSCFYASVTSGIVRALLRKPGFTGTFKDFRPSEWLVWGAIAAALACIAEYHWPNEILRDVAWNSALVLAAVYWFGGLAIVVYGVHVLRPSPLTLLGFVLVVMVLSGMGMLPVLALVGLFDTWGDYRRKLDVIGAARRPGGPPPLPLA